MFVTPGRTKQPGEFMSGRGMIACYRCGEFKRKDKMIFVSGDIESKGILVDLARSGTPFCKHCRAVLVYKLRQLEEMALLSE